MYHSIDQLFATATPFTLQEGETLFRRSDKVMRMFRVLSGSVQLLRHSLHGSALMLQEARKGEVVAEASLYSEIYHCDGVARQESAVAAISCAQFLDALENNPPLAIAWAKNLAHQVQSARIRAELRSLPKVADRLDAWLDFGNQLPEKGNWQDVAAELSVSREALYRELARRRTIHTG